MTMLKDLDQFYIDQSEPTKSCLMALRSIILALDGEVEAAWKYRMPCFGYRDKMFCYLWKDKKTDEPYIGIVDGLKLDHPLLELGTRTRMKILRIDPRKDIPLGLVNEILQEALEITKGKF